MRATFLALALYIFIKGRSRWRGWTIGIPAAIVLGGVAMGLGVYFGLKAVGSEIGAVGSDISNARVTLETISPIDINLNQ